MMSHGVNRPPSPRSDGPVPPSSRRRVIEAASSAWREAQRLDWLAKAAVCVLGGMLLLSVIAATTGLGGDPRALVGPRLSPPSAEWWLGTDSLGRSTLARLFEGMGTTLVLSITAVAMTAVLASLLGIVAGYYGGRVGGLILRFVDVIYAFPALILAILIAALVGPGRWAAVGSIILITIPLMTRMVRINAASVSSRDFILSARISGLRDRAIMARHVLPNVAGTIAVQGGYALSLGILVEGSLSFLGYGVQLPEASLGLLIQEGAVYLTRAPWLLFAPGIAMVGAILSINVICDSLRDRFEPREARSLR
jgi:peptide/nickel transport system permease protein